MSLNCLDEPESDVYAPSDSTSINTWFCQHLVLKWMEIEEFVAMEIIGIIAAGDECTDLVGSSDLSGCVIM